MIASLTEKLRSSIFGTSGASHSYDSDRTRTTINRKRPLMNDGDIWTESLTKKSRSHELASQFSITGMPHWLSDRMATLFSRRRTHNENHHGNGHASGVARQRNDGARPAMGGKTRATRQGHSRDKLGAAGHKTIFHRQPYNTTDESPQQGNHTTALANQTADSDVASVSRQSNQPLSSTGMRKRYKPDYTPQLYTSSVELIDVDAPPSSLTPIKPKHNPAAFTSAYEKIFMRSNSRGSSCESANSTLRIQNNDKDKARYKELLIRLGCQTSCRPNASSTTADVTLRRPSSPTVIVIDDSVDPSPRSDRCRAPRESVWSRLAPPVEQRSPTDGRRPDALRLHPSVVDLTKHTHSTLDHTKDSALKPHSPIVDLTTRAASSSDLTTNTTQKLTKNIQQTHSAKDIAACPASFLDEREFLQKLKDKYDIPARETNRKICEAFKSLELDRKDRTEFLARETARRAKHRLRLSRKELPPVEDIYISSDEDDEVVLVEQIESENDDVQIVEKLPELTEEMERAISAALSPRPGDEVLSDGYNIKITRSNMHSLYHLNWLNDEIINFYMQLLNDRGKDKGFARVHCFSTFFYEKLQTGGYAGVRRWTKKIDIFECEYVVAPIHMGCHWCLAVIDFHEKSITYYDSMRGSNEKCLHLLRQYVGQESVDKKKAEYDMTGWKTSCRKDIPEQENGSDCGVFACQYAESVTRQSPITFTQANMPYFRRRMVYEILMKRIL